MSTEHAQHMEPSLTRPADTDPGVHDHATEVKHAWHHFWENLWFFVTFLTLILFAVLNFEVSPGNNYWFIFGLGAARCALIGFFMFSLVRPFSLIVAAFAFTILFFGGMVWLSMWDSTLPKVGDPIEIHHLP